MCVYGHNGYQPSLSCDALDVAVGWINGSMPADSSASLVRRPVCSSAPKASTGGWSRLRQVIGARCRLTAFPTGRGVRAARTYAFLLEVGRNSADLGRWRVRQTAVPRS